MPKVKVPRKSIALDMTAMCDMAFLLLTFFMLTTKFKPEEPIVVDTPSSVSEIKLPDKDLMQIYVGKEGEVFFGLDAQTTREEVLVKMGETYNVQFTEDEKKQFSLLPSFGTPIAQLKQLLQKSNTERSKIKQPGIPCDSTNNELKDWIHLSRVVHTQRTGNPLRIAIRGDRESKYLTIKEVINTLQTQEINRFNLVTNMEVNPMAAAAGEGAATEQH